MTVTLQDTSQNYKLIGYAMSSYLVQENVCCPNLETTSLASNFGPQVRLPDDHFGKFLVIGQMELLRPAKFYY